MTCKKICGCWVCGLPTLHRLRLPDGGYVFMEWRSSYLGPTFYRDRAGNRELEEWEDVPGLYEALDWFIKRGHRS